tara:strand:+ start:73178 stop:73447 length:270 start_codon:yes stop_codon:yes gene_type:complete
LYLLFLSCFIFFNSCKQNENTSESEIINKVNAVQKQLMVQGNLSEQERQAILSLSSLVSSADDFTSSLDLKEVIEFEHVKNAPVYPGCE